MQRFPRSAYSRRLTHMQDRIGGFEYELKYKAALLPYGHARLRVERRILELDELWHLLEAADQYLRSM